MFCHPSQLQDQEADPEDAHTLRCDISCKPPYREHRQDMTCRFQEVQGDGSYVQEQQDELKYEHTRYEKQVFNLAKEDAGAIMDKMTKAEKKRIEALDNKIEKLQVKIMKKNEELDPLIEELKVLLEERHPERKVERIKQELYDAYRKSDKTVEEIIQLIEDPNILDYLDWTD